MGRERVEECRDWEEEEERERGGMCNRKKKEARREKRQKERMSSPTMSIQIHPHVVQSISRYR